MIHYQTLEEMVAVAGRHIQDTGTTRSTKIKDWINYAYRHAVDFGRWPGLIDARETGISAAVGESFLYLPKDIDQAYFITSSRLDAMVPYEAVEIFFRRRAATNDVLGEIYAYTEAGEIGRKADFSSTAETLSVNPGGSGETFDVMLHGMIGDDDVFETVTCTNSTTETSVKSFSDLLSVSSNGNHSAAFTVSGVTSGTTYASVGERERTARYRRLRLNRLPTVATPLTMYVKRRVQPLTNDDDVPEIPVSHYLTQYAMAMQYSQQRKREQFRDHMMMADATLQEIFAKEINEGNRMYQAAPMSRRMYGMGRRHGTIIVNNS